MSFASASCRVKSDNKTYLLKEKAGTMYGTSLTDYSREFSISIINKRSHTLARIATQRRYNSLMLRDSLNRLVHGESVVLAVRRLSLRAFLLLIASLLFSVRGPLSHFEYRVHPSLCCHKNAIFYLCSLTKMQDRCDQSTPVYLLTI